MNVKTKTVVITGGASGLGLAATKKFVESGFKTVIIGRNENNLADVSITMGDLYATKFLTSVT